jgi:hypothetical protein
MIAPAPAARGAPFRWLDLRTTNLVLLLSLGERELGLHLVPN